jgi:hypothetical protein
VQVERDKVSEQQGRLDRRRPFSRFGWSLQ